MTRRDDTNGGTNSLAARLGSEHDAQRLCQLDHKIRLTPAEGRELARLEKRAGMR